ncbi:hypothetical protein C8R45DRAFT_1006167 [Mycena sanguinolenta]|nr:hypothetical protein C8R45DRAFT_1006167 [Mycena sanguinolenta]
MLHSTGGTNCRSCSTFFFNRSATERAGHKSRSQDRPQDLSLAVLGYVLHHCYSRRPQLPHNIISTLMDHESHLPIASQTPQLVDTSVSFFMALYSLGFLIPFFASSFSASSFFASSFSASSFSPHLFTSLCSLTLFCHPSTNVFGITQISTFTLRKTSLVQSYTLRLRMWLSEGRRPRAPVCWSCRAKCRPRVRARWMGQAVRRKGTSPFSSPFFPLSLCISYYELFPFLPSSSIFHSRISFPSLFLKDNSSPLRPTGLLPFRLDLLPRPSTPSPPRPVSHPASLYPSLHRRMPTTRRRARPADTVLRLPLDSEPRVACTVLLQSSETGRGTTRSKDAWGSPDGSESARGKKRNPTVPASFTNTRPSFHCLWSPLSSYSPPMYELVRTPNGFRRRTKLYFDVFVFLPLALLSCSRFLELPLYLDLYF